PLVPERPGRVADVVAAALTVVARDGLDGLTMQAVAAELRIKAPSLYKHVDGKRAIEVELITDALVELGDALHHAVATAAPGERTVAVLAAYRRRALAHPDLYRLTTRAGIPRHDLPPGLEVWAGVPFRLATGDPYRGQALWAFAHGMVVLEIDRRFVDASHLDTTWAEGAAAFS
ncbi:MAG TPA: TetR family transcriptional regulator, partial [Acidimicrobiales bacterium]|nr:TetR family transcriptional regulator [Acidimicrobiales bacterium]